MDVDVEGGWVAFVEVLCFVEVGVAESGGVGAQDDDSVVPGARLAEPAFDVVGVGTVDPEVLRGCWRQQR